MESVRKMPLVVKAIAAGSVVVLIGYLMTFAMDFDFSTFIMYASGILTVLAVILSGTAVSGDRMRANNYSSSEKKNQFQYTKIIFLFAIPFYIILLITEFL